MRPSPARRPDRGSGVLRPEGQLRSLAACFRAFVAAAVRTRRAACSGGADYPVLAARSHHSRHPPPSPPHSQGYRELFHSSHLLPNAALNTQSASKGADFTDDRGDCGNLENSFSCCRVELPSGGATARCAGADVAASPSPFDGERSPHRRGSNQALFRLRLDGVLLDFVPAELLLQRVKRVH
jgi:hypothetical protein